MNNRLLNPDEEHASWWWSRQQAAAREDVQQAACIHDGPRPLLEFQFRDQMWFERGGQLRPAAASISSPTFFSFKEPEIRCWNAEVL